MITVVGESLIDVVRRTDGSASEHLGGSPFNVAVGLARQGAEVALATRVGPDARGQALLDHAKAEGVTLLGEPAGLPRTSTATATLDPEGVASYEFDLEWDLPALPVPPGTSALHTGSLGLTIEPGASVVLAAMREARREVVVSYDPNARPGLTPDVPALVRRVEEAASLSHVVKASEEDFAFLYPDQDFRAAAARWLRGTGTHLVVVTRGGDGAWAATRSVSVDLPAQPTEVVDTVGAGDAFEAGLLDALRRAGLLTIARIGQLDALDEAALLDLVRQAATVGSLTCERAGANPPTRAEVEARLRAQSA
ncbi:fructokinase [Motilibacter rhizosphaerae]|uniref:Fructokinase n=1 Tax=Motilibacter rhizosphaerae TaxID=598652 RepID=A0A4Q7NPQ0_9ACTN|nr:carbohydrate kinase [Motilibacter rhizosphaerae]RZS87294.1 fructokinase [Motilibacter rhizosphaerae]